jgi:RNA polymerase sigma-70 factor (ECF subfamily)
MADRIDQPEEAIRRLYAYVAYRIGDGPDAEDVVSDTIERALRYGGSFDPTKGTQIAWLFGIARRCLADAGARTRREQPEVAQSAPADVETTVTERLDLTRALETLNDRDRELVALRYGGDLTPREIGDILGMRVNTVEVAIHRVLEKLRAQLHEDVTDRERRSPRRLAK